MRAWRGLGRARAGASKPDVNGVRVDGPFFTKRAQTRRKHGEEQGRDATKFLPLSDAAKEAAIHVGVRLGQVRHPTVYAAPRMSVNIAPKATGEDARPTSTCEPDVLERIIAEARRLARIEGADAVRPRDIERAAAKAGGRHAAADLVPISPPCWQPSLEVRAWSNVLCAWRDDDLAVLHNLSASAYAERQQARQAAPS